MRTTTTVASLVALTALGSLAAGQSNTVPGLDVELAFLDGISVLGRQGSFPNGISAVAVSTTICNRGTVEVPWMAPMNPAHPTIVTLVARELDGRFVQVSDWSAAKHGFFALTSSQCTTCRPPSRGSGDYLGLGCSDTYSAGLNGDRFYLGPLDEIDPWLGTWDPICSHFDRGDPQVSPPFDCDGNRSLTGSQADNLGPIKYRVQVSDAEFNQPDADFYFQSMYIVEGEADSARTNTVSHRAMNVNQVGGGFSTSATGSLQHDSVLNRWPGALIASASNGGDDGRLYVGVRTTGPVDGLYHYEFAVHNRDNSRGVREFRLPFCDTARLIDFGFHDIDDNAANQWEASVVSGELVVTDTSGANPLRWNSIFSFWFDSDMIPGVVDLDAVQDAAGAGAAIVPVVAKTGPSALYNVYGGDGCALGTPPTLYATGVPARATLGNASFGIASSGNVAGQPNFLFAGGIEGTSPLGSCTMQIGGVLGVDILLIASTSSDGSGVARYATPIPNDLAFEGLDVHVQCVGRNPGAGATFRNWELSDGLKIRAGSSIPACE